MRSPQLQGRHPVPCHANQGAHRHRLVLLGTEARDRSLNLYDDPRARRRAAGRLMDAQVMSACGAPPARAAGRRRALTGGRREQER